MARTLPGQRRRVVLARQISLSLQSECEGITAPPSLSAPESPEFLLRYTAEHAAAFNLHRSPSRGRLVAKKLLSKPVHTFFRSRSDTILIPLHTATRSWHRTSVRMQHALANRTEREKRVFLLHLRPQRLPPVHSDVSPTETAPPSCFTGPTSPASGSADCIPFTTSN